MRFDAFVNMRRCSVNRDGLILREIAIVKTIEESIMNPFVPYWPPIRGLTLVIQNRPHS